LGKKVGFPFNYALKELGVTLKIFDKEINEHRETAYFEPHTRSFDWEKYKV
jgi:hypothetical protein